MGTYKIHITGIVQGVGFRPLVYNLAKKLKINGTVSNNNQGVIIHCSTCATCVETFLELIIKSQPKQAVITHSSIEKITNQEFEDFTIIKSICTESGNLLVTPDYAVCPDCLHELNNIGNKRLGYPFITCTNCGPRYSIINNLPYDRHLTTMKSFHMCPTCQEEYNNPIDRRFYSQTNSCPDCGISLTLFDSKKPMKPIHSGAEIKATVEALKKGAIVAVKGIGGYLIMVDALNSEAVKNLRKRKNRLSKPFALMVLDENKLNNYCTPTQTELLEWNSTSAPIVLFPARENNQLPLNNISPGLNEIGIMKAYTPLHVLLCKQFGGPLIATSANVTDSPIIYTDTNAQNNLNGFADLILSNNREIIIPQDDSVLRFTNNNQKITIRRSRGIAPNYFLNSNTPTLSNILAVGAMLKSAFAITQNGNVFISQYLGATNSYETQQAFTKVYQHLSNTLQFSPETIITDKHPAYFSTEWAEEMAESKKAQLHPVQHHEAHFCAVLGENNLWDEKVLGFVWDGTGLGNDNQIWGSETMVYEKGEIERVSHLPYQKHILGDKMVNEPRISALSFFSEIPEFGELLKEKFSTNEWKAYQNQLQTSSLYTSSMGRLFDAVSSILNICNTSSYHGEAAMLLESTANSCDRKYKLQPYPIQYKNNQLDLHKILRAIVLEMKKSAETHTIAAKFHQTLAQYVLHQSKLFGIKNIAFSGGVFQNKLLVELITKTLGDQFNIHFHKQLSPNDECISFGQLMHYKYINKSH